MENEIVNEMGTGAGSSVSKTQMNFLQRLIGIIINPERTTQDLSEKPRVLFPVLLFLLAPVVGIIGGWSVFETYMRQSMDAGLAQNPNVQFTPEMIDSLMNMYKVMMPIIIIIVLFLFWFIGTAFCYGFIKLFKGDGRFKQYLSVTGYSSVIILISSIVILGTYLISGTMLDLSPAVLLPDTAGSFGLGFLKGIFSSLNIFTLWYLFVACVGFKNVSKLGKAKIYGIVLGIYAVLTALSALLAGYGATMM